MTFRRGFALWAAFWLVACVALVGWLETRRQAERFTAVNLSLSCSLPEAGTDIYLMDGSFEGFRGVVTGYQSKPGQEPIMILRTYHDGLSIMVPCMGWVEAAGPYTSGE